MASEARSAAAKRGWETRRRNMKEKTSMKTAKPAVRDRRAALRAALAKFGNNRAKTTGEEPNYSEWKVIWHQKQALNEIYNKGMEMALVNGAGQQCHSLVLCKDFLQDAVWAEINKTSVSIYGFTYTHRENPRIGFDRLRMLVTYSAADFGNNCIRALAFMRELEAAMGFSPSELRFAGKQGKSPAYVFSSDGRWLHAPALLSFYALALRVGMTYDGSGWRKHLLGAKKYLGKNDKEYATKISGIVDKIVTPKVLSLFHTDIRKNYPAQLDSITLHNDVGICGLADGSSPAYMLAKKLA